MAKRVEAIRAALGEPMIREFNVDVRGALCFVSAEWSLFAKPFELGGVWVGWPKGLNARLRAEGSLEPVHLAMLMRRVAAALSSA
jgi:hypothetical protein